MIGVYAWGIYDWAWLYRIKLGTWICIKLGIDIDDMWWG